MNSEIYIYAKTELKRLQQLIATQEDRLNELREYKGRRLCISVHGRNTYYYEKRRAEDGGRRYLGSSTNEDVKGIKETVFLEEKLRVLINNEELLKRFIDCYERDDMASIMQRIPRSYRFSQDTSGDSTDALAEEGRRWLKIKKEFKERHQREHPDRHPDSFKVQRANGEWMRSRAEVMIADALEAQGIPFIYELPHYCNDKWIKTDFTILSTIDYSTEILLEHVGLMSNQEYRRQFIDKVADYMKAGYKPNVDLFFTFDNLDQSFSLLPLQFIIDNWLKP